MNKPNMTCRVCRKEYFCCADHKRLGGWKTMACSEECFREYMRRIEASRKPAETDGEAKEEMTAQVSDENHVKSVEDPECRKF